MKLISKYLINESGAGPKAPRDIEEILKECKFECITIKMKSSSKIIKKAFFKIFYIFKRFIYLLKIKDKNEIVVIQNDFFYYPFIFNKLIKNYLKKRKIILFVHDINGLRYNNEKYLKKEIELFNSSYAIIAHNEKMKKYLISKGVTAPIYILELFDYLTNEKDNLNFSKVDVNDINVAYAGNLIKSQFIKQINSNKMNFNLFLYGKGINDNINEKVIYIGNFMPEELPNQMLGDFGLVWDGMIDESDENKEYKNYTRYNNPHKLSCYIAAGIPVIVWRKSAAADLVNRYNIGYTVSNLYDINKLDLTTYEEKKKNIKELSKKVRKGYFTQKVLNKIIDDIGSDM